MIKFLYDWQTLVGAFIGGVIGLLAALLVARDARHREERAAAMVLVADMVKVNAAYAQLEARINEANIPDDQQAQWMVDRLLGTRPKLFAMFDSALFRIMPVHEHLAAHLTLFRAIYSDVEDRLERLREIVSTYRTNGQWPIPPQNLSTHINLIHTGFRQSVEHARCARPLLETLVLGQFPTWNRIRLKTSPTVEEKACIELLKTGGT